MQDRPPATDVVSGGSRTLGVVSGFSRTLILCTRHARMARMRRDQISQSTRAARWIVGLLIVLLPGLWLAAPPQPSMAAQAPPARGTIPRTADGRPNLQGIWQVRNRAAYDLQDHHARHGMPAGRGVVEGGEIPYQPWAAKKKLENFTNRATADPLAECYMPGVPRIMYMEFPFQIFQTPNHVAMTFEW